ncbi:MAG: radical SAM protein [Phycisphaerae bacterium]|nr:radical SAM protein [Phycisphaerae bacterium]
MKVLLVEPDFPYPNKSKHQANKVHRNFVPVGLLKLGTFYQNRGAQVKLVRGEHIKREIGFVPTSILVTSIFTYWSDCVWRAVSHYRALFPHAEIIVGGIYVTLHHRRAYFRRMLAQYDARCHVGLHSGAEAVRPDYTLLESGVDHHVTHAMRGCIRRCSFCGTWRIEPRRYDKPVERLVEEIVAVGKARVLFFDNNFLAHGDVETMLTELAKVRVKGRPVSYESQSGFDGRLLQRKPELAELLKKANFKNVRIAWDSGFAGHRAIRRQIDILNGAGYRPESVAVFMIYNHDTAYEEMLRKVEKCKEWGVQINDCRYRPLDAQHDNYNSRKYQTGQTDEDYHIHACAGWTDAKVRDFRRRVRRHNIWVRYAKARGEGYDRNMERWSDIHNTFKFFGLDRPPAYELMENSPTWKRRIHVMKRLRNFMKRREIMAISLEGLGGCAMDCALDETCRLLGVDTAL